METDPKKKVGGFLPVWVTAGAATVLWGLFCVYPMHAGWNAQRAALLKLFGEVLVTTGIVVLGMALWYWRGWPVIALPLLSGLLLGCIGFCIASYCGLGTLFILGANDGTAKADALGLGVAALGGLVQIGAGIWMMVHSSR